MTPTPPPDFGLLNHISDLFRVMAPAYGIVAGLVVWAFKRLEKSDEKVIKAIEELTAENDRTHDQMFSLLRDQQRELSAMHEFSQLVRAHHRHQHGEDIG